MSEMGLHEAASRAGKLEKMGAAQQKVKQARVASAPVVGVPTRRSSRLQAIPAVVYSDEVLDRADRFDERQTKRPRAHRVFESDEQAGAAEGEGDATMVAVIPPPVVEGSLRSLNADLEGIQSWLGQSILPPGGGGAMKASAMALLHGTPKSP
eukprot:CAMPEP_0118944646 /NCGR_PEP_ID=MMETSP1169-20130426/40713_1 /TAXON_ID=36882 /ORGANISM="Pyramimonas obovata, Strain CCMP722" /LENGTH=152 /DNA_ID=CAMNT_0006890171 /DNA_START=346 /DNA_END=800 /DNA_ORIENTATION=+